MIRALVVLLAIVPLLAQRKPVDEAWDLLAKGERAKAVQVLQRLISANPKDAEARLMYGSLLAEDGNLAEAILQLEQAAKLNPRSPDAHHALGTALKDSGRTQAARAELERAIALAPSFAPARVDLGQLLLNDGDTKAATAHLDQAIRLLGKSKDAAFPLYLRARIYSEGGEPRLAVPLYERAVGLAPEFAEAWSELGQARKSLQDESGALAAFQKSVQFDAQNAVSQYRLGAEYLRQGQVKLAVQHLREAYRLNPKDQSTLYSLQSALRQDGQLEEAQRIKGKLSEVLAEIDRESQAAFNALRLNNEGAALEKGGNLPGALEKYRQAVVLDPQHVGIRVNYAVAALRLGQWSLGLSELREALRRDPANSQIKAALEDALRQAPPEFGGKGQRPEPKR